MNTCHLHDFYFLFLKKILYTFSLFFFLFFHLFGFPTLCAFLGPYCFGDFAFSSSFVWEWELGFFA